MPFEPGHPPYNRVTLNVPISDRWKNRAHRELSRQLREDPRVEELREWLLDVALKGEDSRPPSLRPQGGVPEAPSLELRVAIARDLLDRAYGRPSQSVVIDAQLRAHLAVATSGSVDQLATAPLAQLEEIERAALALGVDAARILPSGDGEEDEAGE